MTVTISEKLCAYDDGSGYRWDKTRYDTFKEAEAALRALAQQDTGGADDA